MLYLIVKALELIVGFLVLLLAHRLHSLSEKRTAGLSKPAKNHTVKQSASGKTTNDIDHNEAIKVEKYDSILEIVGRAISDMGKSLDTTKNYENKMESLKLAQRFASSQLVEVNSNEAIKKIVEPDWLREVMSLYMIGAIDFIGRQTHCNTRCRKELIQLVLKSNSLAPKERTLKYFSNITARAFDEKNEHLIRTGAQAAELWLVNHTVPTEYSLNEQLGWWRYEFVTSRISRKLALAS